MLGVCLFSHTGSVTRCTAGGLHGAGLLGLWGWVAGVSRGWVAGLLGVARGRGASLPSCLVDGSSLTGACVLGSPFMIRRRKASETAHYIAQFRSLSAIMLAFRHHARFSPSCSLCAVMLSLRDFVWCGANGKKFEPACLTHPKAVVGAVTLTSELRANVHNELRRLLNS